MNGEAESLFTRTLAAATAHMLRGTAGLSHTIAGAAARLQLLGRARCASVALMQLGRKSSSPCGVKLGAPRSHDVSWLAP